MTKRRVVITGLGLVTPLGLGNDANWEALRSARSGVGLITHFDTTDYPVKIAAEVRDFDPLQFIDKKELKKMDRFIHFAIAAAQFAVEDSGLDLAALDSDRAGVSIGSGIGGLESIERQHKVVLERGPKRISPFFIPGLIVNLAAGHVSIRFRARGPNLAHCTACSTGTHAVGEAFRAIQYGHADRMICRRHRGGHLPAGRGRVRGDEGPLHPQRRPGHGQPALRRHPRRLRDGRGRRGADPRGAGGRGGPRSADLCRAERLRDGGGRLPYHCAQRGR